MLLETSFTSSSCVTLFPLPHLGGDDYASRTLLAQTSRSDGNPLGPVGRTQRIDAPHPCGDPHCGPLDTGRRQRGSNYPPPIHNRCSRRTGRLILAAPYFIGGVLLAVQAAVLWANLDANHWVSARRFDAVWMIALPLLGGTVLGVIGRVAERRLAPAPGDNRGVPSIDLGQGERAIWFGHSSNRALLLLSVGLAVTLFLTFPVGAPDMTRYVAIAIVLVVLASFASLWVTVTTQRVRISLSPWRWPTTNIPIASISSADVRRIHALQYGGWGYRLCGRGCRGLIVRSGEALIIKRTDGRSFVVTVDDAARAAGLINDTVKRTSMNDSHASP